MRFRDVQHQERALAILRRALRSGRMHHAYLFEGPAGVGKELAGRALAAGLLCHDETREPDADACGQCSACRLLAADNHPDFHLIHRGLHKVHPERNVRASKGLYLVVDLIRHFLIEPAGLKPTQGTRRVFLIRDAERMNEEAQNALLKTLEEPPGSVCLILVTAAASRLLPTIRSRCQCITFGLLPPDFVARELADGHGLRADAAQALAALAGGRLGVAIRWQQIGLLERLDGVAGGVERLAAGDVEAFGKTIIEIATDLAVVSLRLEGQSGNEGDGENAKPSAKTVPTDALRDALKLVLLLIAALHRDALMIRSGADGLRSLPRGAALVEQLAEELGVDRLDTCLCAVSDAEHMLDRNVAPQLVCERLGVALRGELPVT